MRQDPAQAAERYRKAADQGDATAQSKLGVMYLSGRGVPQDYVEAHKWYNLAASRSNEISRRMGERDIEERDTLTKQMTPAQVAEAQRLPRPTISLDSLLRAGE